MAQFLPYIQIVYAVRNPIGQRSSNAVRGQLLTQFIVIGTPGTAENWCKRMREIDLNKLRMFVIDEADLMIATEGFQKICVDLVRGLDQPACQMMLFSATYSDEVMRFAREIVNNPVALSLKREKQTLNNIRQFFICCYETEQKFYAIEQIYTHHSVRELTAAIDIEQRAAVIGQFRERVFNLLISTNAAAC
ncbi:unnamed protein product, partial [Rotaria sp. Silwood2]